MFDVPKDVMLISPLPPRRGRVSLVDHSGKVVLDVSRGDQRLSDLDAHLLVRTEHGKAIA